MKITESRLRQIIREEVKRSVIKEDSEQKYRNQAFDSLSSRLWDYAVPYPREALIRDLEEKGGFDSVVANLKRYGGNDAMVGLVVYQGGSDAVAISKLVNGSLKGDALQPVERDPINKGVYITDVLDQKTRTRIKNIEKDFLENVEKKTQELLKKDGLA